MKREEIFKKSMEIIQKAGFYLAAIREQSGASFDLIARRDNLLILVRIVFNIDSLTKEVSDELKLLAKYLNASVFVIGEKSTGCRLEPGVVYSRYGIPIINLETLEDLFIHGVEPFSHSAHGGFYATLDGKRLQELRFERQIPLSELAERAGVSRRAIQMYEKGMDVSIDTVMRLEEFLGEPLITGTNIFSFSRKFDPENTPIRRANLHPFEREVIKALERLGTHVIPILRCPFNALATDENSVIITGISRTGSDFEKRIDLLSRISIISEKQTIYVVDSVREKRHIKGVPIVGCRELDRLQGPEDIEKLMNED